MRSDALLAAPTVGDMRNVDLRHVLEELPRHVRRRADSRRTEAQLSRPSFREGDEFPDRLRRHRGIHCQNQRADAQTRDRNEIGERVVSSPGIQVRVHRHRSLMHDDKGVPVRRAVSAELGADVATGAGLVVDDHGLSQDRCEALSEPSCANVGYAAELLRER